MKSKWLRILTVILFLILMVLSPMFQVLKSYTVMALYSQQNENASFLHKEGIDVKMKGGLSTLKRDYYPFVMYYDTTEEYTRVKEEPINLVVLYNFPYMKWLKGASVLYDESSPYYSTFYGMYIAQVEDKSRQFGMFENGDLNIKEIMEVTDFDLKELVIDSIGNNNGFVEYEVDEVDEDEKVMIDNKSFQVINAKISMNGLWHEYNKNYMAYIQYGTPKGFSSDNESFSIIDGYGRIYIHFNQASKVSYFGYIIATDLDVLNETEEAFILTTRINE